MDKKTAMFNSLETGHEKRKKARAKRRGMTKVGVNK
jgi:hypothetical protein